MGSAGVDKEMGEELGAGSQSVAMKHRPVLPESLRRKGMKHWPPWCGGKRGAGSGA